MVYYCCDSIRRLSKKNYINCDTNGQAVVYIQNVHFKTNLPSDQRDYRYCIHCGIDTRIVKDIFHKYVNLLKENRVPFEELIFTKRTSKNSDEYQDRNTIENSAIKNLIYEAKSLKAGETLQYIIVDYYQKHPSKVEKRAIPAELIFDDKTTNAVNYDIQRYTELLADSCNSVTKPFGLTLLTPKSQL